MTATTAPLRFDGFHALGARRITSTIFQAEPGSAVVVSWRLRDEHGARVITPSAVRSATLTVPGAAPTAIRVSRVLGSYVIATPISKSWVGKTVVVTVTLSDNTVHTAELRVRLNRRHTGGHDR